MCFNSYFLEFTQAESLISVFKEVIKKQNVKIQYLQDNNCKLEKEKEYIAGENYKLLEKIKKLENEFRVKNSQLVILELYLYILQILS